MSSISPARHHAYHILSRIEERRSFSDYALHSGIPEQVQDRDRRLATEIVYGTLRWQAALDYLIAGRSTRPWSRIDTVAKIVLRLTMYQLGWMDRVPVHAAIHDAVSLCKEQSHTGVASFVNAMLRSFADSSCHQLLETAPPWAQVSLPRWLWERWLSRYGAARARDYALSVNEAPPKAFWLLDPETPASSKLQAFMRNAKPSDLVPDAYIVDPKRRSHDAAPEAVVFSDEASQMVPHLLDPCAGALIWDVCAAPGGKTLILSNLVGPSGRVVATELHQNRATRLKQRTGGRYHAPIEVVLLDASANPPFRNCFDVVLVDVPCSGLGTLRRNPEIKWRVTPETLAHAAAQQGAILSSAARAVRPGGQILYSTCSTEPEENEKTVELFLSKQPHFRLRRPSTPTGIETWIGSDGMVRTFPSQRGWDGFFVAKMVFEGEASTP